VDRRSDKVIELTLTHRELVELLEIVETMNPPDTLMLSAGTVKITSEASNGIGSILRATVPLQVGERWGEWTTNITDQRHW
jgi:hypothetical protein